MKDFISLLSECNTISTESNEIDLRIQLEKIERVIDSIIQNYQSISVEEVNEILSKEIGCRPLKKRLLKLINPKLSRLFRNWEMTRETKSISDVVMSSSGLAKLPNNTSSQAESIVDGNVQCRNKDFKNGNYRVELDEGKIRKLGELLKYYDHVKPVFFNFYIVKKGDVVGIIDDCLHFLFQTTEAKISVVPDLPVFKIKYSDHVEHLLFDKCVKIKFELDKMSFIKNIPSILVRNNNKYALMNLSYHMMTEFYDRMEFIGGSKNEFLIVKDGLFGLLSFVKSELRFIANPEFISKDALLSYLGSEGLKTFLQKKYIKQQVAKSNSMLL